ncbi:MAG: class I SAM-dependent methyltransferase [Gemmatimonas sp.]
MEYDIELARHHAHLMRAVSIRAGDRVLDIGCGTGQTTRDVARLATDGCAIGIDIMEQSLRRQGRAANVDEVTHAHLVCSDGEHLPFAPASFDVAISRFGTMFFDDPTAAFREIYRSLRPAGCLVMMVWQTTAKNEWAVEIDAALNGATTAKTTEGKGASAFSLGDTMAVKHLLHSTGFVDVTFEDVREPVNYGATVESALAFVRKFATVSEAISTMSPADQALALEQLRQLMNDHLTDDGVLFQSASWIVTALTSAIES